MKRKVIINEDKLLLLRENLDNIMELQPFIDHLAYKIREVIEHFRKNLFKYKEKYNTNNFNIAKFNEEFPNIKNISEWQVERDNNFRIPILKCYLTRNDDEENTDDLYKHNRLYKLLKKEITIYNIFNQRIPDAESQNINIDNRIKIYINNGIDTSSVYQYSRNEISRILSLLDDKKRKELTTPIKYDDMYRHFPKEIKCIISNLWNESNMNTLANGSFFGFRGEDKQIEVVQALSSIKAYNDDDMLWQEIKDYLSGMQEIPQTDNFKEYFISESNRKFREEFIPLLTNSLQNREEVNKDNENYEEYFKANKYLYEDTRYGQLRIAGKNRNGLCAASIWMLTPEGNLQLIMNNHYKANIKHNEEGSLRDCIKRTISIMVREIIPSFMQRGYRTTKHMTWEEAKQKSLEPQNLNESLNNFDAPLYHNTSMENLLSIINRKAITSNYHRGYSNSPGISHNWICFTRSRKYNPYTYYDVKLRFDTNKLLNQARGLKLVPYQDAEYESLDEYEERLISRNGKPFELGNLNNIITEVLIILDDTCQNLNETGEEPSVDIETLRLILDNNIFGNKLKIIKNLKDNKPLTFEEACNYMEMECASDFYESPYQVYSVEIYDNVGDCWYNAEYGKNLGDIVERAIQIHEKDNTPTRVTSGKYDGFEYVPIHILETF